MNTNKKHKVVYCPACGTISTLEYVEQFGRGKERSEYFKGKCSVCNTGLEISMALSIREKVVLLQYV